LPSISDKLSVLQGITLPHGLFVSCDNYTEKIEGIIEPLVVEQMDTLLKEIDAELKTNPAGLDKKQLVKTMEEHFLPSYASTEGFLTSLAKYCPALLEDLLYSRLADIEARLGKGEVIVGPCVGYMIARKIAEQNHLSVPKLSDDDVARLKGLFDKMLINTLGPDGNEYIFWVAEACKWMREVFSISGSLLFSSLLFSLKICLIALKNVFPNKQNMN
jgi:hypothetical protein